MPADPASQPPQHLLRGLRGFFRQDASGIQLISSVAVVLATATTTVPLGLRGSGLAALLLLIVSSVLILARHIAAIPDTWWPSALWVATAAAAALVALSEHGSGYLFAFFVAGHAGYRLNADRAVPIAIGTSVLTGGVLLLRIGPGHHNLPWVVGAATGFSVVLGMANRSRQQALTSALAATEAAERAAASEAREAVLAERGRIARDVHDVLAHSLAGINLQLEVADAMLDAQDLEQVRTATRRAQSLVRESLLESQRTVRALREDTLPLVDTLQAMLESSGHTQPLRVQGEVRDVQTRPAQALVRIAQESLTNIAKHAPVAEVALTLSYGSGVIELDVLNAAGLQAATPAIGSGMGLIGMRERVALLAGSLTAGPVADGPYAGGWRVHAIVPA
jgi:signal transduction histidine kinase